MDPPIVVGLLMAGVLYSYLLPLRIKLSPAQWAGLNLILTEP